MPYHCASPGKRKWPRNSRSALSNSEFVPEKSKVFTYSRSTAPLNGYRSGGPLLMYSPIWVFPKPGVFRTVRNKYRFKKILTVFMENVSIKTYKIRRLILHLLIVPPHLLLPSSLEQRLRHRGVEWRCLSSGYCQCFWAQGYQSLEHI